MTGNNSRKQVLNKANQDPNQLSGNDTVSNSSTEFRAVSEIVWDWLFWSGTMAFDGMDFAGEVLANFLGLNESKYQWIIDAQVREEEEKQQRQLVKRQRRQLRLEQLLEEEQRKLQELEIGAREQNAASVQ
eukprot:jgi/Phyca11/8313/fgenesh1_pm.PHYCAscaffold_27_\